MAIFLQILGYTLPSVVLAIVVFFMMKRHTKNEEIRLNYLLRKETAKTLTPVKLRAYERMALFLERMKPESLLMRQELKNVSSAQLQRGLNEQIRKEWEHNLSQQLYLSHDAWIMLYNAKENMIQLVNTSAMQMPPTAPALSLATAILETYKNFEKTPIDAAIDILKRDIANI
jgi:hypothetical protein